MASRTRIAFLWRKNTGRQRISGKAPVLVGVQVGRLVVFAFPAVQFTERLIQDGTLSGRRRETISANGARPVMKQPHGGAVDGSQRLDGPPRYGRHRQEHPASADVLPSSGPG